MWVELMKLMSSVDGNISTLPVIGNISAYRLIYEVARNFTATGYHYISSYFLTNFTAVDHGP